MQIIDLVNNGGMYSITQVPSFFRKHALKIMTGFFALFLLAGTWFVFKKREFFPEDLHIAIQSEFQEVIKARLLSQNPKAKNITFHQLWTETTNEESQIRATFSYSFKDDSDDGKSDVRVSGTALINKIGEASFGSGSENWEIGNFKTNQTEISFNDAVLVIEPLKKPASQLRNSKWSLDLDDTEDTNLNQIDFE